MGALALHSGRSSARHGLAQHRAGDRVCRAGDIECHPFGSREDRGGFRTVAPMAVLGAEGGGGEVQILWAAESAELLGDPAPESTEAALHIAVVLCDDHPTFARGLALLLEDEADDLAVVGIATTAAEVEELVGKVQPDVVVMDVRMPGIDGIEATLRVREASPTTKVVMLSASDEPVDLYRALRAGASGWIGKDVDASDIAAAVRAATRGQLVIPAGLAGDVVADLEAADPSSLTEVERDILCGIARGETNRQMAERLFLSERTLRRRVENVYSKLHLTDRLQAALWARQHGIGDTQDRGEGGGGR